MRLRALRQEHGLTQTQVGAVIGKRAPTVYRIEMGLSTVLLSDLKKLAALYGVPVQELVDDRHVRLDGTNGHAPALPPRSAASHPHPQGPLPPRRRRGSRAPH